MNIVITLDNEHNYMFRVILTKLRALLDNATVDMTSELDEGRRTYIIRFPENTVNYKLRASGYLNSLKASVPSLNYKFIGNEGLS